MENCSNTSHCREFSRSVVEEIFIIKVVLGSLGAVLSLVVLFRIGVEKLHKQFVYRLVMYVMVVNTHQAVCQVFEILPIEVGGTPRGRIEIRNSTGWPEACSFLGYFDIVTSWNGNFVVVWIMLYMLAISWKIYQNKKRMLQDKQENQKKCLLNFLREFICVVLVFLSPHFFSWIPFVIYGHSDPWC